MRIFQELNIVQSEYNQIIYLFGMLQETSAVLNLYLPYLTPEIGTLSKPKEIFRILRITCKQQYTSQHEYSHIFQQTREILLGKIWFERTLDRVAY